MPIGELKHTRTTTPYRLVIAWRSEKFEVPEQGWEPREGWSVGDWVKMGVSGLREPVGGLYGVLSVSHLSVIRAWRVIGGIRVEWVDVGAHARDS